MADLTALECSEQLNFEASPEMKAAEPVPAPVPETPQMDDAAALLLMLGAGGDANPPALTLPQSQMSAAGAPAPGAPKAGGAGAQPSPASTKRAVVKVDRVLRCGAARAADAQTWEVPQLP